MSAWPSHGLFVGCAGTARPATIFKLVAGSAAMTTFTIFCLIAATSCLICSVWSYTPPFYLRTPESRIFTGQGTGVGHRTILSIRHTFGCRLGIGGQRDSNRRRLDLRGTATLQIRANTGQVPLDAANEIISKSSQGVQPVIICGPSGVGKVIAANFAPFPGDPFHKPRY